MEYLVTSPTQLGQVARGVRKHRRQTQAQVASRVGILQKAVSLFETDPTHSKVERLFQMLSALDLEVVLRDKQHSSGARGASDW